jgi:protein-disulfide isomerase
VFGQSINFLKNMKKTSKKSVIVAVLALVFTGFAALVVHNYKTKTSFRYDKMSAEELKPEQHKQDVVNEAVNADAAKLEAMRKNSNLLKILPTDIALGDKNASVVFIEYASLSCPHCAAFARESFEKLKTEYIDSGKVLMVYRDFPLNQPALAAAMFAICQAEDNKEGKAEKYYATIKALLKTQDSWAFDAKYEEKLEAIARLDGMSQERFKSCLNNKNLQERILSMRMETAKSLQIKSTPAFFINGEVSEGYIDYLTLKKLIDKKLSETSK